MKDLTLSKSKLLLNVLIVCLILYFSQGPILPTTSQISKLILICIILISVYYALKVITLNIRQSTFIWTWLLLISLNIFGYLLTIEYGEPNFGQIKTILIVTLPFYPFYYLSLKKLLKPSHLKFIFLTMIIVSILQFYYSIEEIRAIRDKENIVNNVSYYFVMLLPYIFLFRRKILAYVSLFIILFFVIQSAKRGALIVSLAATVVFIYYQIFTNSSKRIVRNLVIATIGLSCIFIYLYRLFLKNEFLVSRLNQIDEGGSGRSTIYSNLLSSWYNSDSIFNFIFGYGFRSSVDHSGTGNLAHNDWLEILINFGILGFLAYLSVLLSLVFCLFNKTIKREYKIILFSIILIWLLISFFSMFYTSMISVFLVILLAFILGDKERT